MIIQTEKLKRLRLPSRLKILGLFLLLTAVSLVSIYFGALASREGTFFQIKNIYTGVLATRLKIIPNFASGLFSRPPHLFIDMRLKNVRKLAQKREEALDAKLLIEEQKDFLPATLHSDDETVKIRLRLKGDFSEHRLGRKWSYRIKVRGDETLLGMREFSIMHPARRNYLYEWLFFAALRREKILTPEYRFVQVSFNGDNLGIYALEEHFEKRLVEHQHRPEGPILALNEDLLRRDYARFQFGQADQTTGQNPTGLRSDSSGAIKAFNLNRILQDPLLSEEFLTARNLLEAFRLGKLPVEKVFDAEKMATFFAMADLMDTRHALLWCNMRFYYNPVTALLEPVAFDGNAGFFPVDGVVGADYRNVDGPENKFLSLFFSEPVFLREYLAQLRRLSEPAYLENLFAELDGEIQANQTILNKEFFYIPFSKENIYAQQKKIALILDPVKGVHAYFDSVAGRRLGLSVGNIQKLPIEIQSVSYKASAVFQPEGKTLLPGKDPSRPVAYQTLYFDLPAGFAWSDNTASELSIHYNIAGVPVSKSDPVFGWIRADRDFAGTGLPRAEPNFSKFPFLAVNEEAGEIAIRQGDWNLTEDLIIPQGYTFIAGGGTRLNLLNHAMILSYSPLQWIASPENPIVIHSSDKTGQGLAVLKASKTSRLQNVLFKDLTAPSKKGWALTGAVTFYESPVEIYDCRFAGNRSEDALHIIRSELNLDRLSFSKSISDALDIDFGNGKISHLTFSNPGNDGLDASGSVLDLADITVEGAGDKGLSVGEASRVEARRVVVKNSNTAAASKDQSRLDIQDIYFSNCKTGLAVFRKKPEFGPAAMTVKSLEASDAETPYLVGPKSTLLVDGKRIDETEPANQ